MNERRREPKPRPAPSDTSPSGDVPFEGEDRLRGLRVTHPDDSLTGVILSMEGVNFIDTEGADSIKKIALAGQGRNIDFHLARVKPASIRTSLS